jgi:hypothetical protein
LTAAVSAINQLGSGRFVPWCFRSEVDRLIGGLLNVCHLCIEFAYCEALGDVGVIALEACGEVGGGGSVPGEALFFFVVKNELRHCRYDPAGSVAAPTGSFTRSKPR